MLAFYLYPFEPNQKAREYTEDDLKDNMKRPPRMNAKRGFTV